MSSRLHSLLRDLVPSRRLPLSFSVCWVLDDVATSIPNANAILAAKARRIKLRENPNAEEFISLDGQSGTVKIRDAYDMDRGGPHPDSRLVREEDEEGDGADGELRLHSSLLPSRASELNSQAHGFSFSSLETDHAEFTEANDRIPLGKQANRDAARRMKAGISEMIDDALVLLFLRLLSRLEPRTSLIVGLVCGLQGGRCE